MPDEDTDRRERRRASFRRWYAANKSTCCERLRARRAADIEKVRAERRAWYAANREKCCAQTRSRRAAAKIKTRNRDRRWYSANKDKVKARKQRASTQLLESYVKQKLRRPGDFLRPENFPPELVALKRAQLQLKRQIKKTVK